MSAKTLTIVVVDDDADMNTALKRLLTAAGYVVITYASAEALIARGISQTADCMVFDVHLPGMSGFDLLRHLRRAGISTPVIFITAFDETCFLHEEKGVGAITCINKPFPGQTLLTAITDALNQSRTDPEA